MKSENRMPTQVSCGFAGTDGLWLCHLNLPLLMFFSSSENAITDTIVIPYIHDRTIRNSFSGCICNKEVLILSPYNAEYIVLYYIEKKRFVAKKLKGISKAYQQVFLGNFIYENDCFFFPCKYRFLVRFNISENKLSYIEIPTSVLKDDDFITKFVVVENAVVATLFKERAFLIYNIKYNDWEKKKITGNGDGFSKFIFLSHRYIVLNYSEGIIECFNQSTFKKESELNVEKVFGHSIETDGINIIRMNGNHIMINVINTGESIVCDCSLNIIRDMFDSKIRLDRGYAFSIEDASHRMHIFEKHRHGIVNEDLTITFEEVVDNTNACIKAVDYCAAKGIIINETNEISLEEFLIGINNSFNQLPGEGSISSGIDIYRSMII